MLSSALSDVYISFEAQVAERAALAEHRAVANRKVFAIDVRHHSAVLDVRWK